MQLDHVCFKFPNDLHEKFMQFLSDCSINAEFKDFKTHKGHYICFSDGFYIKVFNSDKLHIDLYYDCSKAEIGSHQRIYSLKDPIPYSVLGTKVFDYTEHLSDNLLSITYIKSVDSYKAQARAKKPEYKYKNDFQLKIDKKKLNQDESVLFHSDLGPIERSDKNLIELFNKSFLF